VFDLPEGLSEFLDKLNLNEKGNKMEEEPKACTPEEFAKLDPIDQAVYRITEAWQKQVPAIIETGQILIEEKEKLDHGQFTIMIERRLPFGRQTAFRLMAIAEHPILAKRQHTATLPDSGPANVTHVQLLPASWGTLYELTKVDHEVLEEKIKDGTVNRRMERKDAEALAKAYPKDKSASKKGKEEEDEEPKEKEKRKQKTQEETKLEREVEALKSHIAEIEAARDVPVPNPIETEEALNQLYNEDNKAISAVRTAANKLTHAKKSGDETFIKCMEEEKEAAVKNREKTQLALQRKKEDLGLRVVARKTLSSSDKSRLKVLPGFGTSLEFSLCAENLVFVTLTIQEQIKTAIKESEKARKVFKRLSESDDKRKVELIELASEAVFPEITKMREAIESLKHSWEETLSLAKGEIKNPAIKAQAKKPSLSVVPTAQIGTTL